MRTSNKLLLGGFLAVLLLLMAIHITLYAKYKKGDYTTYHSREHDRRAVLLSFTGIRHVKVHGVWGVKAVFAEKAQVMEGISDKIKFVQKGDTLEISGKPYINLYEEAQAFIQLPYNASFSLSGSYLMFGTGSSAPQHNPSIRLEDSRADFTGTQGLMQLGHVQIEATDSSTVGFGAGTRVGHLQVQLSDATLENTAGEVEQLSILTDSVSRISLPVKQLLKASIKTKE